MENWIAPGGVAGQPPRALMVGRETELAQLQNIATRTSEAGAHVLFIAGEAGIGKSTLIREFLHLLRTQNWGTHVGQCIEYSDRAIPFGPIVTLIRSVLEAAGEHAEDVLGHQRADLAALLPEWRSEGVDHDSLRGDVDRLIDAISTVVARAAEVRPMVLFVEDIHWADSSTRDVIASLVHSLRSAPVLVVVSERTGAMPRGHQLYTWLSEQRRFPNVTSMSLEGLAPEALAEQAQHILGEAPSAELISELEERTGGNAYFASELLLARKSGSTSLPTSLADFLTSRLERLSQGEQDVLRAVAVAGGTISHQLLTAALPDLETGPFLRQLFDNAIIVMTDGEYSFAHALMREAMLRNVLPFEVEDLHRRMAEAISADPLRGRSLADLTALATHWSGANDRPRAFQAMIAASAASAGVAAYAPAADLAIDALGLWDAVPDPEALTDTSREELLLNASDWLAASNDPERAAALLVDALDDWGAALSDGSRALLLATLAPLLFIEGESDRATSLIEQATALIGDEVSPEAAQVHHRGSKIEIRKADVSRAEAAADRAIAIASDVGPERILAEALGTKALCVGVTKGMEEGIEIIHESRRLALAQNLVSQVAQAYRIEMMIIYFRKGRIPRTFDVLREGIDFASQRCGPKLRLELLSDLALGLTEDGSLVEARPLLDELLGHQGQILLDLTVLHTKALCELLAGDLDAAEAVLDRTHDAAPRFTPQEWGFQNRLRAELARRRGDFDQALTLIDTALESQRDTDNVTFTRESIIERCRLVHDIAIVDNEQANALLPSTEALIDELGLDEASAALTSLMVLLLDRVKGTARAADALEVANQLAQGGFGADAKQTMLVHAQLLSHEQPKSKELAQALDDLRELSRSSGMSWLDQTSGDGATGSPADTIDLTDQTVVDLSDAAGPPQRVIDDHGLTPREIEILGYLARGLTNKEIGSELYVSHRTVSTHVSNLLAKLHLRTRAEAASKYHELGFAQSEIPTE